MVEAALGRAVTWLRPANKGRSSFACSYAKLRVRRCAMPDNHHDPSAASVAFFANLVHASANELVASVRYPKVASCRVLCLRRIPALLPKSCLRLIRANAKTVGGRI